MRQALPKGLVRYNLYVPPRQEVGFDFLRVETEASSDSEVTRQATRYYEQFVNDNEHGIILKLVSDLDEKSLSYQQFRDPPDLQDRLVRRSLILHERTKRRLERLREATDAKDLSEVVRSALRYYRFIVESGKSGAQFFAVMPSGEEYRVQIRPLTG